MVSSAMWRKKNTHELVCVFFNFSRNNACLLIISKSYSVDYDNIKEHVWDNINFLLITDFCTEINCTGIRQPILQLRNISCISLMCHTAKNLLKNHLYCACVYMYPMVWHWTYMWIDKVLRLLLWQQWRIKMAGNLHLIQFISQTSSVTSG